MSSQDAALWRTLNAFSVSASNASTSVSSSSGAALDAAAATLIKSYGWPQVLDALRWAVEGGADPLISMGVSAVGALLSSPAALASLHDAEPFLVSALASSEPRIRVIATRLLRDISRGSLVAPSLNVSSLVCDGSPVLGALAEALGDPDAGVAALVGDTFAALGKACCGGAQQQPDAAGARVVATALAGRLNSIDGVARLRVLEGAVRVAGAGEVTAEAIAQSGLIERLLESMTDSSDPLMQVCVIESLEPLGCSVLGFLAFARVGGVEALLSLAGFEKAEDSRSSIPDDINEDTDESLVSGAALGALAGLFSGVCSTQGPRARAVETLRTLLVPGLLNLSYALTSRSHIAPTQAAIGLDALARVVAADEAALEMLLATVDLGPSGALISWLELCASSAPELRLASLGALARVLRPQAMPGSADDEKYRAKHAVALLDALGIACRGSASEAPQVLFAAAAERGPSASDDNAHADPATASRWAAFDVLSVLAALRGSPQGVRAALGTESSLLELPAATASNTARQWRHAVLSAAAANPVAPSALGPLLFERLLAAAARHPNAQNEAESQVATASRAS